MEGIPKRFNIIWGLENTKFEPFENKYETAYT